MNIYVTCRLLGGPAVNPNGERRGSSFLRPQSLSSLEVKNFGLFAAVHLDFAPGHFQPGSLGCLAHCAPYPAGASMTATYSELADALSLTFASRPATVEDMSVPAAQKIGNPHYFGAPEALAQED